MISATEHLTEVDAWHANRMDALKAEDGWLHLTDRIEVAPGRYHVGRAPDNDICLSAGPDHLGLLRLADSGDVTLETPDGVQPFLPCPDAPPRLKTAGLLLEMMQVEGQFALRVRDLTLPDRSRFPAIPRFPLNASWRIVADWIPLAEARPLAIDLVGGINSTVMLSHHAVFDHDGSRITLLPTHWKAGRPMFVFRDVTSGEETYAASRFLIGEVQGDKVVLDFNKAFNPPCAFTDLAVCPLPPPENRLPFAIRAGELRPDMGG